jgi:hypothetical protein
MANVSLIDPYSQKAEEIANRRRMAQALQEQGSQILDMPTMPGVAISPYAGLAKVLQVGLGAYEDKQARKEYADLQNEYRTNYNTQLGEMARLISAPEVKGVAGTNEIPYEPAQTEKIYGTKPAPVMGSGYGSGMLMPDQVIGEKVIKPEVPYQAAVAPVQGQPAGYISAADLQKIDIPEVKQLLMAKYLKQFEPERVTLGDNQRLLERTGGGPFRELAGVAPAKADKLAPHWEATTQEVNGKPVSGWINLNATDKAASFVAGAKPTEAKAATPHWVEGQKDVDGKKQFGWYDLNSANKDASFKAGANPPAGEKSNWKEVNRDGKVFYEDFNIADDTQRQAKARVKEAAKVDQIQLEVQDDSGAKKTILVNKDDPRLKEGIATKGADTVMITEVNDKGQPLVRYVKKGDPILATGYVKPLDGFLGQLQQAGVPMDRIQNDPKIRDLVDRYFVKTAGGVAPEEAAGFELRKAEVVARLGELGVAIPANIKGLSLSATPGVLGGTQPASAASASTTGANDIKSKVEAGGLKYEPAKYDYRINADGSVQRKAK